MPGRRSRRDAALARGVTRSPELPGSRGDLASVDLDDVGDDDALTGVRLTGDAVGRTVDGLSLRGAIVAGCRLTGATLSGLDLHDVVLTDCDLSGATLAGAVLRRVTIERCRLSGVVANDVSAEDVTVRDCRAEEAWLRAARLEHCDIADCELTGSDWYGAVVRRSRILRTRLDGSELSTAVLDDVALHGSSLAGVRGADLRDVVIGTDQIMEVAVALFATRGIVIDDAAGDETADTDAAR
jgi:uncharacterized protein YjbI with pentapeptide repeats